MIAPVGTAAPGQLSVALLIQIQRDGPDQDVLLDLRETGYLRQNLKKHEAKVEQIVGLFVDRLVMRIVNQLHP